MTQNLFSHAPSEPTDPQGASTNIPENFSAQQRIAVYTELNRPLHEAWTALTEYAHLWWPKNLLHASENHIELGEHYLIEEEYDDATQHHIADTKHFAPEDVAASLPQPEQLGGTFTTGFSFTCDDGDAPGTSTVEISSGIVKPREFGDSPLGVLPEDLAAAENVLGGFARFMSTKLIIESGADSSNNT